MAAPTVSVDRLSINYALQDTTTKFEAVQDMSFAVWPHEIVAVVGPSGCGKSSLISAIAGLLPYEGSISLSGSAVVGPTRASGVVFQQASLLPWRSIADNVTIGMQIRGEGKAARRARAAELLDLAGIGDHADRYPHQLSGGMQQRANLVRALASSPEILLLDEPFAALDAQTREIMQTELLRIWAETKASGLFITHQIDEAVFVADRILVMSAGPRSNILEEIESPFPRPRDLSVKRLPEFQEKVDHIWTLLSTKQG